MSENTFPPQIKKSYFQGKEPEKRRTKSLLRVCLRLLFTNTLYVLVKSRSKQEAQRSQKRAEFSPLRVSFLYVSACEVTKCFYS